MAGRELGKLRSLSRATVCSIHSRRLDAIASYSSFMFSMSTIMPMIWGRGGEGRGGGEGREGEGGRGGGEGREGEGGRGGGEGRGGEGRGGGGGGVGRRWRKG